jgi:hypothetical protein
MDGIYPCWLIFQQIIHEPQGEKSKHYAQWHEVVWKDVEQSVGVLQSEYGIVLNPFLMMG